MTELGLYAPNGSRRVSIVDGNSRVGRYAADGSINVVVNAHESDSSPYVAKAVNSGGSAYLSVSSFLASSTSVFSLSFWYKIAAFDGVQVLFAADPENNFTPVMNLFGQDQGQPGFFPYLSNPDQSKSVQSAGIGSASINAAWHNLILSGESDLVSSNVIKVYIDDIDVSTSVLESGTPFLMIFSALSFSVLGTLGGQNIIGDVADVWIAPNVSLLTGGDITEADRRLFISAEGKPVDPAGFPSSAVLFSGDSSTFPVNQGTGGAFTLTGSLTNASTSPSD